MNVSIKFLRHGQVRFTFPAGSATAILIQRCRAQGLDPAEAVRRYLDEKAIPSRAAKPQQEKEVQP